MSDIETKPGLSKAYHSAKEVHNFAINTGVPRRDTFDEHGIRQKWSDRTGDERTVMTKNASITQSRSGRVETDMKLPTGEYRTGFYTKDKDAHPFVEVLVERPGYLGAIGGRHRERATEIIAQKAAKEVGETAVKRSIKVGDEYLKRLNG